MCVKKQNNETLRKFFLLKASAQFTIFVFIFCEIFIFLALKFFVAQKEMILNCSRLKNAIRYCYKSV